MDVTRRCVARARSGQRCKRAPIPGGKVCRMHGGGAPQVRRSARERLAALVDPALDAMHRALVSRNMRAVVAAARDILDRTVGRPAQTMEHRGQLAVHSDQERTRQLLRHATDEELTQYETWWRALEQRAELAGGLLTAGQGTYRQISVAPTEQARLRATDDAKEVR